MDNELEAFLNSLGEAERAGGRVLHELTEQAQSRAALDRAENQRPGQRCR